MAIGKGGSSQNQNQSGTFNTDQTTTGTQNTSQTQNVTGNQTSNVIIPDEWKAAFGGLNNLLGNTGQTADQGAAANYFRGQVQAPYGGQYGGALATINSDYLKPYTTQAAPTLGASPTVAGQTGAAYAQPYQNAATNDVVNAATNDLKTQYDRTIAQSGLTAAAGGAFGGARQGVREAQIADDFLRNAASTSANTRFGAFQAANQFGAQDASNAQSAATANAQMQTQRDIANQQAEAMNRQSQLSVFDRIINNVNTVAGGQNAAATNLLGSGSTGVSQLMGALGLGTQTFGNQSNTTGTTNATGTANTTGTSNTSGTTQQSGGSSGKNGGVSICWVAREVYGIDGPWMDFRTWLLSEAPAWLLNLYTKHGERFAAFIQDKPRLKRIVKFCMDRVI